MYIKLYTIQFLNDLRYQKLRAFLTLFGLVWGTTAILTLIAISDAQKRNMLLQLKSIGENVVMIWPGRTTLPYKGFGRGRRVRFYPEDVQRLRESVPGIDLISGEISMWDEVSARYKKVEDGINLAGVEPDWGELRNIYPAENGRFIQPTDIVQKRRVVFIGNELKETFFGSEDAIGKLMYINKIPFQVIGVMQPKYEQSRHMGKDSRKAFIPLSTLILMLNKTRLESISYRPKNVLEGDFVLANIKTTIAQLRSYHPDDKNALHIWDTGDHGKWIANFAIGIQLFFGIVGLFTVIVAGIGVANIMNVIVEERTREIGIKMALGMKRRIILIQFMFETFLMTFLGGCIGLGVSMMICYFLGRAELENIGKPYVTVDAALIAVSILGTVAFVAGVFPARRAATLEPVEALRWQG
jgi:putative ABC transport system permease protein